MMDAETRERFRRIGLAYPGEEQEEVDPEFETWAVRMPEIRVLRPSAFRMIDLGPEDEVVSD